MMPVAEWLWPPHWCAFPNNSGLLTLIERILMFMNPAIESCARRVSRSATFLAALFAAASLARAQYDAPADYYNGVNVANAVSNPTLFRTNIHNAESRNYYVAGSTLQLRRSYDDARFGLAVTDRDPNNSANIILIYTGQSISGTWDAVNLPWNREHTWPQSLGLGSESSSYAYSDLHQLRPCDPNVNNSRGNSTYGTLSGQWDPNHAAGVSDRGDLARAMFYLDTRYDGAAADNVGDLVLVNTNSGTLSGAQMGDLAQMLRWHYQDPVSDNERRRNHTVFSNVLNPSHYQGNRSAFVDHPEWVWAAFGGGNNNSKLYVGGSAPSDGTSAQTVNLGRVMVGGTLGTQAVTLNKTGSNPTYFDVSVSGSATITTGAGSTTVGAVRQQAFDINASSRTMTLGLTGSTGVAGLKTGTITIDNTDVTTSGLGTGTLDGNDTVTVTASVLNNRVLTASTVDYGRVIANRSYTGYTFIQTTGDDDHFTRVTVSAAGAGSGAVKVDPAGAATMFNSDNSLMTRSVTANFANLGTFSGSIPLSVSGEGLVGESVQPVSVPFKAQVIDPSKGGIFEGDITGGEGDGDGSGSENVTLLIDFGTIDNSAGAPMEGISRTFSISNADGLRAGLDLDSIAASGDTSLLTTTLSSFLHHTIGAGDVEAFDAILHPTQLGTFSATYRIGLSDENGVGGASMPGSQVLTLQLHAQVVPEPVAVVSLSVVLVTLSFRRGRVRR